MKTYRPPVGTKTRTGLIGQRFGKLVILKMLGVEVGAKYPHVHYLVRCDCGNEKAMPVNNARKGKRSCGCVAPRNNGASLHPLYGTWRNMIDRCYNPAAVGYSGYGGRGITVCEQWRTNFFNFLEDMGDRPRSDLTLDRINNDGNYEPGNCRWATRQEQAANKREHLRSSAIERDGKKQGLKAWAEELGIKFRTISARSQKGYSSEAILSTQLKSKPHLITYQGQTRTLSEWSEHVGIKRKTLYLRVITRKWPLDRAFGALERTPKSGGRR